MCSQLMKDQDWKSKEPMKTKPGFHKKAGQGLKPLPKCRGKFSYRTHGEAERIRLKVLDFDKGKYLRIYKCRWCHYFHLTSQKQTRK